MIEQYRIEIEKRGKLNIPPLPLSKGQLVELLHMVEQEHEEGVFLLELLAHCVEPGVSDTARIKADWLERIAQGAIIVKELSPGKAIGMLSKMGGGFCVSSLVRLLDHSVYGSAAAAALKGITKVYEAFDQVVKMAEFNDNAANVLESWSRAEWFTNEPEVPEQLELVVYKVNGETTTDDFSPGNQAQSRTDIPLHATHFGATRFQNGIEIIAALRANGKMVAFTGDVVGTGSSRKSAVNSLSWHIGADIDGVPNKRRGGVVLAETIAPIFYASARDAGLLPVECGVTPLETGDQIVLHTESWKLRTSEGTFIPTNPPPSTILDEYRAGGRLNLIIGKELTQAACIATGIPFPGLFKETGKSEPVKGQGYTLAQKIVGRACNREGVLPGTICMPKIATVGSQDTTGPMTMQEIEELACLKFRTGLFMQSFCHTAAYPRAGDFARWQIMSSLTVDRGGVVLQPGDGVIHSWLNKMLVPDQVGTGGDSHTRFPLGISFPAGSSLVAFSAALGFMPLEMPDSVLVRFHGRRKQGITVRDMVNAIPYYAIQKSLLTVEKAGKINVFAGSILEIEGVEDLSVDEAYELCDASAERNAAACTVKLSLETVVDQVSSNVKVLKQLVGEGYQTQIAITRRIEALEQWLDKPELMVRDERAQFKACIDINLDEIDQPILACPNDPDDVRILNDCAGTAIDEVFIGSCMINLSHLQAASKLLKGEGYAESRMWVAPATRLDEAIMKQEGGLAIFARAGGRVETPGCSLCMGNQARVKPGATVVSTSTRNFNNRMGDGAKVFLGSTEVSVLSGLLGALPTAEQYLEFIDKKTKKGSPPLE